MCRKFSIALAAVLVSASFMAADTVYLRNGNVLHGEIRSFENGRFTMYLDKTRSEEGSEFVINVKDVARIEFEQEESAELREGRRVLDVVSTQPVSSSGVFVKQGDKVQIEAQGEVYVDRNRRTGPSGIALGMADKPLPRENWGALYAMVGNYPNEALVVGARRQFMARRDGEIFLGINDGFLANNSGSFRVTITTFEPAGPRPVPQRRRESDSGRNVDTAEDRIEVRADLFWTDTGIRVRAGEKIILEASGTIYVAPNKQSGPEGVTPGILRAIFGTLPVPTANEGALIGQFRGEQNSDLFVIGARGEIVAPIDGALYLGINDENFSNNSGSFVVRVRHPQPGRRI